MLNIVTVPDPVLRQVSKPIDRIDPKLIKFIDQLGDTLTYKKDPPGVGISAIQVGHPLRIIMTLLPSDPSQKRASWKPEDLILAPYINPEIVSHSRKITLGGKPDEPFLEGCLSVPHLYGPVWRYQWIKLKYQTLDANHQLTDYHTVKLTSFVARVIQHELDHLDGILFTDYVMGQSPATNFNPLGKINDIYFEQGEDMVPIQDPSALITW